MERRRAPRAAAPNDEDIDGVGWDFLGQFAAAIGCDLPAEAPTEVGEVDCSPS